MLKDLSVGVENAEGRHLRMQIFALGGAPLAVLRQARSQLQSGRQLQTATARGLGVRFEVGQLPFGVCGDASFLVRFQLGEGILSNLPRRPTSKALFRF